MSVDYGNTKRSSMHFTEFTDSDTVTGGPSVYFCTVNVKLKVLVTTEGFNHLCQKWEGMFSIMELRIWARVQSTRLCTWCLCASMVCSIKFNKIWRTDWTNLKSSSSNLAQWLPQTWECITCYAIVNYIDLDLYSRSQILITKMFDYFRNFSSNAHQVCCEDSPTKGKKKKNLFSISVWWPCTLLRPGHNCILSNLTNFNLYF